MAKRSNNPAAGARAFAVKACLALAVALAARTAAACPFCKPLGPTLCQSRAAASITALAEVEGPSAKRATKVKLHRVFDAQRSADQSSHLTIPLDLAATPGTLLLIFGMGERDAAPEALAWHAVAVNEISYAYFARAPAVGAKGADRLKYFARFLEHPDSVVAEDAWLEFAHAPFEDVAVVADTLASPRMRKWLVNPGVPPYRKGFYGLALGLASEPAERRANAELLRTLILEPQDDFRAGFDGILSGYLMIAGPRALELVDSRYLANPKSADGDVRHALAALRFYNEYGHEIAAERLNAAVRHLLVRPEFAEAAVTDLARGKDWDAVDQVARLYSEPQYAQSATRRAIVGFLLACPGAPAVEALNRLREADPKGVAEAEQVLSRLGSVPGNQ
jgi:hypothetical protein